jgi:hypothetical protein
MEQEKELIVENADDLIINIFKEFNISVVRFKYSLEYGRDYREKHKDKIKKIQTEYVAKHREQVNASHREYYAKNKDKMREYLRNRARDKKNVVTNIQS